jgi:protein SCO1
MTLAQPWRVRRTIVLAAGLAGGLMPIALPHGRLAKVLGFETTRVRSGTIAAPPVDPEPAYRTYLRTTRRYDLPDVALTDMHGVTIRMAAELRDPTPIIVEFMYTTCSGICPISTALLAQAQSELSLDQLRPRIWSISIDPEADTPERLELYAQAYGAGPDWRFFTGAVDDVNALQIAFDAYRGNKMRHEPLIFIRAGDDRWVRMNGLPSAAELVDEFRTATRR